MPHILVEYSANLDAVLDIDVLVADIHQAALATGVFPPGGTRTRAARRDVYAIADQHPDNAFIHVQLSIGTGRDPDTRQGAGAAIFAALTGHIEKNGMQWPLALSLAMTEIDGDTSFKKNNLHDFVAARQGRRCMNIEVSAKLKANLKQVDNYLKPIRQDGLQHLIDGKMVASAGGATFENSSPIDNIDFCEVARGNNEDIDRAAQAAKNAFTGWRANPGKARRDILHTIADKIVEHAEEIALLESYDTGQAIRFMQKAAIRGAENFRFFADRAPDASNGLSLPSDNHINYTIRQPIGPVGIITPWNTPFMLSTWKIAPALAAGCTIVHKPAEWSPVTATLLARLCLEAGLPPGVLNLVHGIGEEVGVALTRHPAIKAIAFVGETTTGSAIMAQGAATLKRVHFELGGKNPCIVFADADLDRALDAATFMIYSLNGERCTSSSRVLVERSIYPEFVERLAERAKGIHCGHPLDPNTWLGPLIHPRHLDKVTSYFDLARSEGTDIAAGGKAPETPPSPGNYVEATLFANANTEMRIASEEIFGPVLTALPFDDDDDALRIANGIPYGLAAYIWTSDITRALRMSNEVEAGMVWINSENVRHLPTPFGGTKQSGIGRDGGDYSFDFYMETKNIALATGQHRIPKIGQ